MTKKDYWNGRERDREVEREGKLERSILVWYRFTQRNETMIDLI